MSQGASSYPISLLLHRLIRQYGPSAAEFVRALGYRNIERGLRRLKPWLDRGEGYDRILKQIVAAHPGIETQLELAIASTKVMKKVEAEVAWLERCKAEAPTFRSYIHVDGETSVPNGICIFAVTGGKWNLIEIANEILDLPVDEQLSALPDLMRGYLEQYGGQCPFFGRVRGFKFVRLTDFFQFDKTGVLIGQVLEPFRRGVCSVQIL